jgi:alkaline phosphatase D
MRKLELPEPEGEIAGPEIRGGGIGRHSLPVLWMVAEDEAFARVVAGGIVFVDASTGWTLKLRARSLDADRWYHYRFFSEGAYSRAGRLRTAPRAGATPDRLRYGFASCQQRGVRGVDGRESLYVTHRAIAADGVDFLLHLGDYVYVSDTGTLTLDDYRGVYQRFHSNAWLQDLQAAVPLVTVWDDGEFYNGVDRTGPPERLANARRAWFDMMPVARSSSDRIYRKFAWGRLADFLLLDTRQYRDPEVPSNAIYGPLDAQDSRFPPSDQMFAPGRTTLGAAQEAWLQRELVLSRGAWRMVGSSYNVCPWKILDYDTPEMRALDPTLMLNAGLYVSNEAWDDYAVQRRELLEYLLAHRIRNVVFNSGHTHFYLAAELMPDYDDPTSPVAAFDFTTGSQTADPDPRELATEPILRVFGDVMLRANRPYMKEVNLVDQGYVLVDLTPEECIVSFRVVDTFDPDAAPRTATRFRVRNGSSALEILPAEE